MRRRPLPAWAAFRAADLSGTNTNSSLISQSMLWHRACPVGMSRGILRTVTARKPFVDFVIEAITPTMAEYNVKVLDRQNE
jgi:hypothetical protein